MPVTTGAKVLLITSGAVLTYLVGREVFAKPRVRTPIGPEPEPEPIPDIDYTDLIREFESDGGKPNMGSLYYQRQGDQLFEIARWVINNAGIPQSAQNRIAYLRLVECSPYNQALYTVRLSENAFGQRFRTDPDVGVSGNPQHHDNRNRMMQGLAPRRAAAKHSMTAHETVPGGGRHAFMWLPLLKGGTEVVGPNAVAVWQDGSSAINPPPEILALGFENVPAGEYGCAPWATQVDAL